MTENNVTFTARAGLVQVRRGRRVSTVTVQGRTLRWGARRVDAQALAREMLAAALQDPDPPDRLVRAFTAEVVMGLPVESFTVQAGDVLAWVLDLGTSQHDDLREERRARRLPGIDEDDDGPDPGDPVAQAGGGVAEGFEAAEAALIAHASHADAGGDPLRDAFHPEAESDRATAVYADADGSASEDRRRS